MTESRIFESRFYPTVRERLSGTGRAALLGHMQSVLSRDNVSRVLDLPHPGPRLIFGGPENRDRTELYRILGLAADDLKRAMKDCTVIDPSWKVGGNEFNWAMVLALKALVEGGAREGEVKVGVAFFATHHLAYFVSNYFPFYNQNAMDYMINSMTDKFILKKEGSMFKLMMAVAWKSHEKYVHYLRKGDDYSLFQYFINLRTRLNGVIKNLKNHYETVRREGSYLNRAREFYDDGRMAERESDSGRIGTITDVATERFVGQPTNEQLLGVAARMNDVPRLSLSTAVDGMRRNEGDLVRDCFSNILELFFEERKATASDIRSRMFIDFCFAVYARSNTKDGRVEKIKENLDKLLERHSEAYLRTNREATKGAFRKAIYTYMCLFLQASSSGF